MNFGVNCALSAHWSLGLFLATLAQFQYSVGCRGQPFRAPVWKKVSTMLSVEGRLARSPWVSGVGDGRILLQWWRLGLQWRELDRWIWSFETNCRRDSYHRKGKKVCKIWQNEDKPITFLWSSWSQGVIYLWSSNEWFPFWVLSHRGTWHSSGLTLPASHPQKSYPKIALNFRKLEADKLHTKNFPHYQKSVSPVGAKPFRVWMRAILGDTFWWAQNSSVILGPQNVLDHAGVFNCFMELLVSFFPYGAFKLQLKLVRFSVLSVEELEA